MKKYVKLYEDLHKVEDSTISKLNRIGFIHKEYFDRESSHLYSIELKLPYYAVNVECKDMVKAMDYMKTMKYVYSVDFNKLRNRVLNHNASARYIEHESWNESRDLIYEVRNFMYTFKRKINIMLTANVIMEVSVLNYISTEELNDRRINWDLSGHMNELF